MKRMDHLREMIDKIKKTEEMISMHRELGDLPIMTAQFENLKARQLSLLIAELARAPIQTKANLSMIKLIVDKYSAFINSNLNDPEQKEMQELTLML